MPTKTSTKAVKTPAKAPVAKVTKAPKAEKVVKAPKAEKPTKQPLLLNRLPFLLCVGN